MADAPPLPEAMRVAIVGGLPRLRRFCHALAGNGADGDDLMQATVERALRHWPQFQAGTRIESWMFRIAHNLRIDGARSLARRGTSVALDHANEVRGEDAVAALEARSNLAAAQRALATLPDDQRAVFALVVLEGASYREAAEVLDIPVGTVMSRLARARARIDSFVHEGVAG